MSPISSRHKEAAAPIELSSSGVGVTVSVRKYFRQANPTYTHMPNAELNEEIASEWSGATPIHRFKLRSGEIAEVRESSGHFLIAAMRGRGTTNPRYDIIIIQSSFRSVDEAVRKRRLQPGWGAEQ